MKFIFCNLPYYIKINILLYDEHFILRNRELISIIPKTDYRYKLLNFITFSPSCIIRENNKYIYRYYFQNIYNCNNVQIKNNEIIQIHIIENEISLEYSFWIGRKYPKSICCHFGNKLIYKNPLEYNWVFTNFEFIRFEYIRI
jgi:hypothetical protein